MNRYLQRAVIVAMTFLAMVCTSNAAEAGSRGEERRCERRSEQADRHSRKRCPRTTIHRIPVVFLEIPEGEAVYQVRCLAC